MLLKGAEIARYLARPDPTRPALLIYGQDAMRVALKRAEAVAALTGPDAEAEMRLTRLAGGDLRRDAAAHAAWIAQGEHSSTTSRRSSADSLVKRSSPAQGGSGSPEPQDLPAVSQWQRP